MKKRIYIAGCGGMLGQAFYDIFKDEYDLKCTDKDVNDHWLSFLDFRYFDAYRHDVIQFNPDYLFHLGAYTDLEYCENNVSDTYMNNTQAVENAVLIANEMNIPILYISTAGIFDGTKDEYDDWDMPNPLGIYARSKYMGERYVVENALRYLVCRAGWMMGSGEKDKKFIGKLLDQINSGAKDLYIVNDKTGTPTYTYDFAVNVKYLLETEFWGLYNMACTGHTSRLEVATEMLDILGVTDVKINAVPSTHFAEDYFAPRPHCEQLINLKLDNRGLNKMRHWKIALREYLTQL
jgi:dTDP-4-dehydrorhamnose reductase